MKRNNSFAPFLIILLTVTSVHSQPSINLFSRYTGDWKAAVSMWTSPSDEPMIHSIKMNGEMIMNGLFFSCHLHGEMMGMNYEAINTIGYEPLTGTFESTWIDNQNSNIFYLQGKLNEDGKTIDFRGSFRDPSSNKEVAVRHVYTLVDEARLEIDMFNGTGENEMKTYVFKINKE